MNSWSELRMQLGSGVQRASLVVILALFGAVLRPGGYQPKPEAPKRDPMELIASANDPQMIEAIHIAQATARANSGGNAWSKPKGEGPTATFQTPGGSITLSRGEISDANSVYPHLAVRARHPHELGTMRRSNDAGFDSEFHDHSEWGS